MWSAATTRAYVRLPVGEYLSGAPLPLGPGFFVSSSAVFDGLICIRFAWLVIGIEIADAPELNSPMYAIADLSWAALRALAEVCPGSHAPAWAVESSSCLKVILHGPTVLFTWDRASFSPLTTSFVC